ncbi:hypothetical protein NMY22_g14824 [Coprinellus aureogranulatus]|nr:hypothetical protein NMY22_g14824 [Coprinellus aureogranulatus]
MAKIDPQEFEAQRNKLVSGLVACAEQLRNTAKVVEDFAQLINGLDGEIKGKRKELVFDTDADAEGDGGSKKRKRTTKPKDPNAPKRPASSYILFQNEIRAELRKSHPDLPNPQLLALISEKWKTMPEAEKQHYNDKMLAAKAQYSEEKKAYDARSPEEVEAANRALAESAAVRVRLAHDDRHSYFCPRNLLHPSVVFPLMQLKKANRGGRSKKAAPVVAPAPKEQSKSEPESDEEHEQEVAESDEESDDDGSPAPETKKAKEESSSDDETSEDEEEEPAPKRSKRAGSAQPKSKKNKA